MLSTKASCSSTHCSVVRQWGSFLPHLLLNIYLILPEMASTLCTPNNQYSINQSNALETIQVPEEFAFVLKMETCISYTYSN